MYFGEDLSDPLLLSYVALPVTAHISEPPPFAGVPGHSCPTSPFSVPPDDVVCHVVAAMIDAFLEKILGDHRFPSLQDFKESTQKISPALLSLGVSADAWRDFCIEMENDIAIIEEHKCLLSEGPFLKDYKSRFSSLGNVLADIEAHVSAGDVAVKGSEARVRGFQSRRLEAVTSHYLLRGDLRRVDDEISALGARRRDIVQRLEEIAGHTSLLNEKQLGAEQVLQQARAELETWKMTREDTLATQTMLQRIIADRQRNVSARAACFRSSFNTPTV